MTRGLSRREVAIRAASWALVFVSSTFSTPHGVVPMTEAQVPTPKSVPAAKPPRARQPASAAKRPHAAGPALALTVVTRQWPPLVHVRLRLNSGTFADPAGREGQAALCWRAAVRAGGGRSQTQFAQALDALGGSLEVRVGRHDTLFEGMTLASELEPFLALLADIVFRPRLATEDIAHARAQQLADVAARYDDDEALAHEALVRFAHRGGAAGRAADGDPKSLAGITAAHCGAYHRAVISAAVPHFGFAGAITTDRATTVVRTHFGALLAGRSKVALARNRPLKPPHVVGRRLLLLDHPGRKQATVMLGFPTVGSKHGDQLALRLADAVLGGAFSSRLNLRIREQRGWTYSLHSFLRASPETGMWTVNWTPARDVAPQSLDLVMRIVELARKDGVSATETTFGKGFLTGALRYDADTAEAELDLRMHAIALGLGADWLDRYGARVGGLTRKVVSAALRAHIDPSRAVAVIVGDARTLLPALKAAQAGFAVEVMPYRGAPELAKVVGVPVTLTPGPSPVTPVTPVADAKTP